MSKAVEELLRTAGRIVIAQESVEHEVRTLATTSSEALSYLGVLEESLWEIAWQQSLQTAELRAIRNLLEAPLTTQAKELRRRAEHSYANGWIDEAFADFTASERNNPYDFVVQMALGNISFFHRNDTEGALAHFEKAAKYAVPESPRFAALALLHAALVEQRRGAHKFAYAATERALALAEDWPEAHYQHARYCSLLGIHRAALQHIHAAVSADRYYLAKLMPEKAFSGMRDQLQGYLEYIRRQVHGVAAAELESATRVYEQTPFLQPSNEDLLLAAEWHKRGSILDNWNALCAVRGSVAKWLSASTVGTSSESHPVTRRLHEEYAQWKQRTKQRLLAISCLVGASLGSLLSALVLRPSSIGIAFLTLAVLFSLILGALVYKVLWEVMYRLTWMRRYAPQTRKAYEAHDSLQRELYALSFTKPWSQIVAPCVPSK